ncbi:MAG: AEC family transporter [Azospirillaceae bacterium]
MASRPAMSAVINVALPVFAIILIGFVAGKVRLLGATSSEALNKFVYWIALPPLLFLVMARSPIEEIAYWPFIKVYLGSIIIVWILTAILGRVVHGASAGEMTMQGMNASFSNTGYMGIPLFVAAFGEAGLPPASLATVMTGAVSIAIAVISLELFGTGSKGIVRALRDVGLALVRNPLVVSSALGVFVSAMHWTVPLPIETLFQLLGASASPCALFAIGLFMAGQAVRRDLVEVGWISIVKLFWQPLICWFLAAAFFPMDPFWLASAIILAALPTGALTFVVAQNYNIYVQRTSAIILVSTVASVPLLSVLLAIYQPQFG